MHPHRHGPGTFQKLLEQHPSEAAYQIGMANACAMQFEATRTDPAPDAEALRLAESHARHACALDADLAEAWATLGFVLERTGRRQDALAALERAVALEPDNWRHQVRLALGSWGEARLRAARRALTQCPQLPLAHWLAATVFVARNALDQAERDVDRALAVAVVESPDAAPYSMVALQWGRRQPATEPSGKSAYRLSRSTSVRQERGIPFGEDSRSITRGTFDGPSVNQAGAMSLCSDHTCRKGEKPSV